MNKYIATVFTHFAAISFSKELDRRGIKSKMMPVPRRVSSSCGSCVCFETESLSELVFGDGIDKVFSEKDGKYILEYENKE